jgi:hypothetical protein
MQRSLAATAGIFQILDSEPTVQDARNAVVDGYRTKVQYQDETFSELRIAVPGEDGERWTTIQTKSKFGKILGNFAPPFP